MHSRLIRCTLGLLAAVVATLALPASAADQPQKRPNVILLLADDMGYADPSCFGGRAVRTPNIDALAAGGLRMTQFYAASVVYSPMRASILTGRYPLRFDIRNIFFDDECHLPAGTLTLPKLLQQNGYRTAHVGKWHLGGLHKKHFADRAHSIPGPREHGFDHYLCQIEEPQPRRHLSDARRLYRDGGTCLVRNDQLVTADDPYYRQHWTDITGQESLRLIEQFAREDRPFFLDVWWLVPHQPYEPGSEPHWTPRLPRASPNHSTVSARWSPIWTTTWAAS